MNTPPSSVCVQDHTRRDKPSTISEATIIGVLKRLKSLLILIVCIPSRVHLWDVPEADTVEDLGVFDRAGRERSIIPLEILQSDGVSVRALRYCFQVFGLLPGLPQSINFRDKDSGKVDQDGFNAFRGVSGEKVEKERA